LDEKNLAGAQKADSGSHRGYPGDCHGSQRSRPFHDEFLVRAPQGAPKEKTLATLHANGSFARIGQKPILVLSLAHDIIY
jgi:hypothetical protein